MPSQFGGMYILFVHTWRLYCYTHLGEKKHYLHPKSSAFGIHNLGIRNIQNSARITKGETCELTAPKTDRKLPLDQLHPTSTSFFHLSVRVQVQSRWEAARCCDAADGLELQRWNGFAWVEASWFRRPPIPAVRTPYNFRH